MTNTFSMTSTPQTELPYIHRDISWLSFNHRVLQEAMDPGVPLFERIKFIAIYSNNLNEFFRVRVASLRNLYRVGKKTKRELEYEPKAVLREILKIVERHQVELERIMEEELVPQLRQHGIHLLRRLDLNEEQQEFVQSYFNQFMLPYVQPVLLIKNKVRPFLNNAQLYMSVLMKDKEDPEGQDWYAIVKIPSDHLPRFLSLPSSGKQHHLIMLDDVVRFSLSEMFPGYDIKDTYSIKLTRDAELYIDDEFSGDLIEKIRKSLIRRHVGPPSRFVYDRQMPEKLLTFLCETFGLEKKIDLIAEGRYHNNFDFFKFPDFGMKHLKYPPMPPLSYKPLEDAEDFFDALSEQDHLLNYPYHAYESVIRFFEEAAKDPHVTHIKIIQYRVARKSRIMDALKKAVKKGKQVFAFIEVKARFDEEANLAWGEELQKAGINVRYSFPGLKVHAKVALVRRLEKGKSRLYAYMSTGNFHEDTARVYSDFGFFTTDPRLTKENARLFSFLETMKLPSHQFEHLLVGQFNLRKALIEKVQREIKHAKAGEEARILLKLNSLQDREMIELLYKASRAGVQVQLIVRGICSLVPGLSGISENIEAISIVDRFLEHARVFIFHNKGKEEIYFSSADWMVRNLRHRIETAFPIYDPAFKKIIKDLMQIQLSDNVKARIIDAEQSNRYRDDSGDLPIRSQVETYYYLKRLLK